MDHYWDLTVLPDPEFQATTLINALYAKLHRAMAQSAPGQIGVSFPKVDKTLGNTLRLHGSQAHLNRLAGGDWLRGMADYIRAGAVAPIPDKVRYRWVRRVQAKSVHNKRKRSVAKGWLSEEEAKLRIPDNQYRALKLPYAQLRSLSNGNTMRVYIEHGPLGDTPVAGAFNSYGLSRETTIPWF